MVYMLECIIEIPYLLRHFKQKDDYIFDMVSPGVEGGGDQ